MPAQMLETSQLERLWLHVLIRVEKKKRFLNDPQLTRGLVMVLVFFFIGRDNKEAKQSARVL